jgi:hypothetical protein
MHKLREAVLLLNPTLRGILSVQKPAEASIYLSAKLDESNCKCQSGEAERSSHVRGRCARMKHAPINELFSDCEFKSWSGQRRSSTGRTLYCGASK